MCGHRAPGKGGRGSTACAFGWPDVVICRAHRGRREHCGYGCESGGLGGGRVNYVIAKDDIGNWYVKQYSTDRTKVFNAMRNVALFSAGSSFGAPMPIRKADGTLLLRTNPVVELQFNKAYAAYSNAMATAVSSLTSRTNGLNEVLAAEFKAVHSDAAALKEFQEEVEAAHKDLVAAVEKEMKSEKKSDPEALLTSLGGHWVQFGEKARKAVNDTTKTELAKAKDKASRVEGHVR